MASSQQAPQLLAALVGYNANASGRNVTADDGVGCWRCGLQQRGSEHSQSQKTCRTFQGKFGFSGRSFSFPRIFLLVGKICKRSLFLKHGLYSALVCSSASTIDVFIFSLLTLAIPGTPPAQQLFVGVFFSLPSSCTFPSCSRHP